jgi:hypothetical protein
MGLSNGKIHKRQKTRPDPFSPFLPMKELLNAGHPSKLICGIAAAMPPAADVDIRSLPYKLATFFINVKT